MTRYVLGFESGWPDEDPMDEPDPAYLARQLALDSPACPARHAPTKT